MFYRRRVSRTTLYAWACHFIIWKSFSVASLYSSIIIKDHVFFKYPQISRHILKYALIFQIFRKYGNFCQLLAILQLFLSNVARSFQRIRTSSYIFLYKKFHLVEYLGYTRQEMKENFPINVICCNNFRIRQNNLMKRKLLNSW